MAADPASGPVRPLKPLGQASLRLDRTGISFDGLNLPQAEIKSVTTERADTLQVARAKAMWQFRPDSASVFRLKNALDAWGATRRRGTDERDTGAR